jgi:hypothetical protein
MLNPIAGEPEVGPYVRRAWLAGGRAALASCGPGGAVCKLSDAQLDRLADELDRGRPPRTGPAGLAISGGPWPESRR